MMPEEDEISLIMKRHNTSTSKSGILAEQRGEHPPDTTAQSRIEIIQNQLWFMCSCSAMVFNIGSQYKVRQTKLRGGAVREVDQQHGINLLSILVDHHQVGELPGTSILNDFLQ